MYVKPEPKPLVSVQSGQETGSLLYLQFSTKHSDENAKLRMKHLADTAKNYELDNAVVFKQGEFLKLKITGEADKLIIYLQSFNLDSDADKIAALSDTIENNLELGAGC